MFELMLFQPRSKEHYIIRDQYEVLNDAIRDGVRICSNTTYWGFSVESAQGVEFAMFRNSRGALQEDWRFDGVKDPMECRCF